MAFPKLSCPYVGGALGVVAALFGAAAIVVGAVSAHGGMGYSPLVGIGLSYHLPHAVAAWAACAAAPLAVVRDETAAGLLRWAALCWLAGVLAFAGGIYLHAFADISLGPVVPIGALVMILGWGFAACAAFRLARGLPR